MINRKQRREIHLRALEDQNVAASQVRPESAGWELGQEVVFQGNVRTIYDIDAGADILALDGDKYICPNHEENRCIEAPFSECVPNTMLYRR